MYTDTWTRMTHLYLLFACHANVSSAFNFKLSLYLLLLLFTSTTTRLKCAKTNKLMSTRFFRDREFREEESTTKTTHFCYSRTISTKTTSEHRRQQVAKKGKEQTTSKEHTRRWIWTSWTKKWAMPSSSNSTCPFNSCRPMPSSTRRFFWQLFSRLPNRTNMFVERM